MMSRKYYELTAQLINKEMYPRSQLELYALRNLVFSMADAFMKDNPRFIRSVFYADAFKGTEFMPWAIAEKEDEQRKQKQPIKSSV